MDMEAVSFGNASVRSSPPISPNVAESASLGSGGGSQKVSVAASGEDIVSISPKASAQLSAVKGENDTTKYEVTGNQVVMKIINADSGQEIRQIPDKGHQKLSQAIQDAVGKLVKVKK